MKRFFSPTTHGIYLDTLFEQMPPDVVELSEERYQRVFANPPLGMHVVVTEDGLPDLSDSHHISLIELHAEKVRGIDTACEKAITSGFTSAAAGAPHQYSSQLDDQLNLTGAVLRGLDMPYACRDEQGVKEFRLHTAEELRQVGDDFTLYKLQLLQHANELKKQLNAALEADDLNALEATTWEAPQP